MVWSKDLKKDYKASPPKWGYSGSPLIEGAMVLLEVGGSGQSVVALDKLTGKERWKNGDDAAGYSSLVTYDHDGQPAIAVFAATAIVGRSLQDGRELWRHPWKTSYDVNAATPVIRRQQIFVSSGYNVGGALLDVSGPEPKVVWKNRDMRNHVDTCVLYEGHLYGFDERELRCLDFQTGEVKWSERSFGKGSLMVADGKLIIYSDHGRVAVAEATPAGYKELSSHQALGGRSTWAVPVLANGRLYCRSMEKLVCLDVQKP